MNIKKFMKETSFTYKKRFGFGSRQSPQVDAWERVWRGLVERQKLMDQATIIRWTDISSVSAAYASIAQTSVASNIRRSVATAESTVRFVSIRISRGVSVRWMHWDWWVSAVKRAAVSAKVTAVTTAIKSWAVESCVIAITESRVNSTLLGLFYIFISHNSGGDQCDDKQCNLNLIKQFSVHDNLLNNLKPRITRFTETLNTRTESLETSTEFFWDLKIFFFHSPNFLLITLVLMLPTYEWFHVDKFLFSFCETCEKSLKMFMMLLKFEALLFIQFFSSLLAPSIITIGKIVRTFVLDFFILGVGAENGAKEISTQQWVNARCQFVSLNFPSSRWRWLWIRFAFTAIKCNFRETTTWLLINSDDCAKNYVMC